jgi:hypothetical protein
MFDDDIYVNTTTRQVSVIKTNDNFDRIITDGQVTGTKEKGKEVSERQAAGYNVNEVNINFANPKNSNAVSYYSKSVLIDAMNETNNSSITINSVGRTPEDQARIMYENIKNGGLSATLKLYKTPGQEVAKCYPDKAKMLAKIYELGPSSVSLHCADQSKINVVDIQPSSLKQYLVFAKILQAMSSIKQVLHPQNSTDKAVHVEIIQPPH